MLEKIPARHIPAMVSGDPAEQRGFFQDRDSQRPPFLVHQDCQFLLKDQALGLEFIEGLNSPSRQTQGRKRNSRYDKKNESRL